MSCISSVKKALVGAAFAALAVGSASAATIVQQQVTPLNQAAWGQNLTFNQFNPNLGTLTGVQIDFTGSGNAAVQVSHGQGGGSVSFDLLGSTVQITAPGLIALTDNSATQVFSWLGNTPSPTNYTTPVLSQATLNVIQQSFWNAYTGLGTFDIVLDVKEVIGALTAVGDFNQVDNIQTFGGADVKLTYKYNVPEPGSLALLALAGGALAFARRRRTA